MTQSNGNTTSDEQMTQSNGDGSMKDTETVTLDEILDKHNGELGVTWEDPDIVTPDTKQAILRWVADEIVPKHEHNNWCFIHCQFGDKSANKFIEEKRETLAQHGYKGY